MGNGWRSGTGPLKLRVDDAISINGPWWTVIMIDEYKDLIRLRRDATGETMMLSLSLLTDAVRYMKHGVRAWIGHPIKWLPIPKGHVYYGEEKGYLPPVLGGYVRDENGRWVPALGPMPTIRS